jgi:hypothetical protein
MNQAVRILAPLLLAFGSIAPAVDAATATDPSAARELSIMFVSGGDTAQSRAGMQRMSSDFDLLLTLVMANRDMHYGDTRIRVTDTTTGKQILDASADGPFFYIQIPPGDYMIDSELHGQHLVKSARIAPHQTKHLTFDWSSG